MNGISWETVGMILGSIMAGGLAVLGKLWWSHRNGLGSGENLMLANRLEAITQRLDRVVERMEVLNGSQAAIHSELKTITSTLMVASNALAKMEGMYSR